MNRPQKGKYTDQPVEQGGLRHRVITRLGFLGLSLADLSRRSGIAQQHITQIMRGSRNPKIGTLHRMAEALRVPIEYFFTAGCPSCHAGWKFMATLPAAPVPVQPEAETSEVTAAA